MKAIPFLLFFFLLCFGGKALGLELLTNPGFESGTAGWFGNSCSITPETNTVNNGIGAVYVSGRTMVWHGLNQDVTSQILANGQGDYTISCAMLASNGIDQARLRIKLEYGTNTVTITEKFGVNDSAWTAHSATVNVRWIDALDKASFIVISSNATSTFYVDDCSLWIDDKPPPPPPPTNVVFSSTNDVPFAEALETYANGWVLPGTNGWSSGEWDAPTVVPSSYSYAGSRPMAVKHEQVLDLGGTITNFFQCSEMHTNVLMDTMMQPTLRTAEGHPAISPDAHASFYFNSTGVLTVYHSVYTGGFSAVSKHWTQLDHTPVADGQWVRVTMTVDYLSDSLRNDKYFSIALDGASALTNSLAYNTLSPTNETTDAGGSWFLCANSGLGGGSNVFSGFVVNGNARLDDIVVSDPLRRTSAGTPYAWIYAHYSTNTYEQLDAADKDGDGMTTRQEYIAGTDPNRADSLFTSAVSSETNGTVQVSWLGSPDGAPTPFQMYRSTNLFENAGGWELIDAHVPRDYSGTNVWIDPLPPAGPAAFYRPAASSE